MGLMARSFVTSKKNFLVRVQHGLRLGEKNRSEASLFFLQAEKKPSVLPLFPFQSDIPFPTCYKRPVFKQAALNENQ